MAEEEDRYEAQDRIKIDYKSAGLFCDGSVIDGLQRQHRGSRHR